MARLIADNMMTLDGYFEGPNHDIDWHVWSPEMERYAAEMLDGAHTLIFGRVTYELMAPYWPSSKDSIAPRMNALPKVVFSRTLEEAAWNNTRIAKGALSEEITAMKSQGSGDLIIFGSATIANAVMELGLLDEYRVRVNPVILGGGVPLFRDIRERRAMKLIKTQVFDCGNVTLSYEP